MNHHARQSLQEQQAQLSRTIANRQRKREAARERAHGSDDEGDAGPRRQKKVSAGT